MHATDSYSSPTEVEDELAVTVYADNVTFIYLILIGFSDNTKMCNAMEQKLKSSS